MAPALSVVIPAYNESARLGQTLQTILEYLNRYFAGSELIVVDDGSQDQTAEIAERGFAAAGRVRTRLLRSPINRGKGHAVRTGMLAARAPIALFTDADLATPISEIPKLLAPMLREQCDVALGSRTLDPKMIGRHQPWRREQGGRVFNLFVRLVTGLPLSDTQCGFKAFHMTTCRPILEAGSIDRFGFDVELLYISWRARLRLREVAVRWNHIAGSTVHLLRDSLRMFGEVRAIKRLAQNGFYDAAINLARERLANERGRRFTSGDARFIENLAS